MEETVGLWWHQALSRVTRSTHAHAAVQLKDVEKSIGIVFRSAGGAAALRLATASAQRVGSSGHWLHKLGGLHTHADTAQLEPDVLALPATLAVFDQTDLNRDLYLWLALLSAHFESTGDWLADNQRATRQTLTAFAGFQPRFQRLLQAHLAQRPDPDSLKGPARHAELAVRAALGEWSPNPPDWHGCPPTAMNETCRSGAPAANANARVRGEGAAPTEQPATFHVSLSQKDAAAVWLWLASGPAQPIDTTAQTAQQDAAPQPNAVTDRQRRRTQKAPEKSDRTAMVLPSRGESIMTWSDMVSVNRSTDDEPDANTLNVANDMDRLAVAPDGQTLASRVKFDLDLPSSSADDQPLGPGLALPEWDYRKARLLPDHCRVQVMQTRQVAPFVPSPALRLTAKRVRRKLETLRDAPRPLHGQDSGDDIDLDAWVRFNTDQHSTSGLRTDTPPVYTRRSTTERSLATLLLADLSLSTDAFATPDAKVIDVIRDALFVFGEALHAVDDPFAVWGFSSVRRSHVRLQHLKHFDDPWDDDCRNRVGAIKPGYYTRMGAAIRHATLQLSARPEHRRLLMLLTDGKPNDLDIYEGRYGLEDTRHAVQQAHTAGLTPFCITIDDRAHDYLPMLFGQQGYAMVRRPQDLVGQLTQAWTVLSRR